MNKTIYIVKYTYYQYNSGQADNGYYWKKIELEDIEKAQILYQKFKDSINKKLSEEEEDNLISDYIPYMGYFTEVKLFKQVVETFELIFQNIGE